MADLKQKVQELCRVQDPGGMTKNERLLYYLGDFVPGAKKILGYVSDNFGCGWYRVKQPAAITNKLYSDYVNVGVTNYMHTQDVFPDGDADCFWDAFLFSRQYNPEVRAWLRVIKDLWNRPAIFDVDDDLFHVDPTSYSYKVFADPETQRQLKLFIETCDHITVSTEPLVDVYKKFGRPITIVPNGVDFDLLKDLGKRKEDYTKPKLTIGWFGSATHAKDLVLVETVLTDLITKYPNVNLVIGGWVDCPFFSGIPADRITRVPWEYDMAKYLRNLTQIDIGITPLADTVFNTCKSNLKYTELAGLGIPVVASAVFPYKTTIKSGVHGLLTKTAGNIYGSWKEALELLINDAKLRQTLGVNGRDLVRRKYTQEIIATQWRDIYLKITT